MKSLRAKKSQKPLLLAFHGFTGESYDFAPLYEHSTVDPTWRFVDLPGHFRNGESIPPLGEQWETFVSRIDQVVREGMEAQKKMHVLAYSMGARLFLKAMLEQKWQKWSPEKIILVGATAGLESESERVERLAHDRLLAENLRHEGMDCFVDEWMRLPLISSQMQVTSPERISRKKQLNPEALADALIEYSNGTMTPVWNRLSEINGEILLVAGEKDEKFRRIHERMAKLLPNAQTQVVEGAGHAPHLETPGSFAAILKTSLA
jgi:2-succinyl-6-hydroxy-2,4-cyclohexadiene-1-carboxylate synthase